MDYRYKIRRNADEEYVDLTVDETSTGDDYLDLLYSDGAQILVEGINSLAYVGSYPLISRNILISHIQLRRDIRRVQETRNNFGDFGAEWTIARRNRVISPLPTGGWANELVDTRTSTTQSDTKKENEMYIINSLDDQGVPILEKTKTEYSFPDDSRFPITMTSSGAALFESISKALELGFIEDPKTCTWYKEGYNKPFAGFFPSSYYPKFNNANFELKPSKTHLITEGKNYSFGVEFECSKLMIPQYIWDNLNINCLRDGSLNNGTGGPEIVTGVLEGDEGMKHLQTICHELTKRGKVDSYCGMHLHLGNFDFSKENLVYLYKICLFLEKEIFSFVPKSRRNNTFCRRLDNLNLSSNISSQNSYEYKIKLAEDFDKLFSYIQHVKNTKKFTTRKDNHPLGAKCGYKHETPRYCWVNFVPTMFNTRGSNNSNSFEIRIHSGTTNYYKTKNWLLLWMGIIWYVENMKHNIQEGITVEHILLEAYPRSSKKLIEYFQKRKNQFNSAIDESVEYDQQIEEIKSIKQEIEEI